MDIKLSSRILHISFAYKQLVQTTLQEPNYRTLAGIYSSTSEWPQNFIQFFIVLNNKSVI
jgi:hypothetical protein